MSSYEWERPREAHDGTDELPDTVEGLETFIAELNRQMSAMELKRKMNPGGPDLGDEHGEVDLDQFAPERPAKPRTEGALAVQIAAAEVKLRKLRSQS